MLMTPQRGKPGGQNTACLEVSRSASAAIEYLHPGMELLLNITHAQSHPHMGSGEMWTNSVHSGEYCILMKIW